VLVAAALFLLLLLAVLKRLLFPARPRIVVQDTGRGYR
jgi:hypothetical protein